MSVTIPALAPWNGCSDCAGGPTPGARALLAYYLESVPQGTSLGIYNCRDVRGGASLSVHACGRAVDLAIPTTDAGHAAMYAFLGRLAPHAEGLGVQYVVFARQQWSAIRHPDGEPYRGVHPHNDHAHVELTPNAAANLTLATLRARVGDLRADVSDPGTTTPAEPPAPTRANLAARLDVVNLADRRAVVEGDTVATLQSLLGARGYPPPASFDRAGEPDGIGGAYTRATLGRFQTRHRTGRPSSPATPDYVAGEATWTKALGTVKVIRLDQGVVRGGIVATVQALLAARGYPPAATFDGGKPDGIGAARTAEALAAFQRATNTGAPDGTADLIVGAKTWAALAV